MANFNGPADGFFCIWYEGRKLTPASVRIIRCIGLYKFNTFYFLCACAHLMIHLTLAVAAVAAAAKLNINSK